MLDPHKLLNLANSAIRDYPTASSFALACAGGCTGDAAAQRAEGVAAHDWSRSAVYVVWTLFVTFVIDVLFYTHAFSRWFPQKAPDGRVLYGNVAKALLADELLLMPFVYFPCFYLFTQSLVLRKPPGAALRLYAAEASTQLPVLWAYWVPANGVQFLAVPPHLRVLYCTVAVTGYVAVLSGVTQRLNQRRRADAARGKAGAGV